MRPDDVYACFERYTLETLEWSLGQPRNAVAQAAENREQAFRAAARAMRMHVASKRFWLLLLGLGDGTLAGELFRTMPADGGFVILETDMERARRVWPRLRENFGTQAPALLADASIWPLFLLARAAGMDVKNCTLCRNPAASSSELLAWQRLFVESRLAPLPDSPAAAPLSVACMLHPEEPELEDFFGHMPSWLHEVCVLWDGAPPSAAFRCPAPLRQSCRPLEAHFGEQRNAMLAMCRTEWCLYLDADERLSPDSWKRLPHVMAAPGLGAALFPRRSFEGDEEHVRMGYGLWPDAQLRLLRKNAALRFEGAVHEKVTGVDGYLALAAGMPILHYSHTRKDRASLQRRLEVFDRAAGEARHRLSESYPRLPGVFFHQQEEALACSLIMLPKSMQ